MNVSRGPLLLNEPIAAIPPPAGDPSPAGAPAGTVRVVEIDARPPTTAARPPGPERRASGGRSRATDRLLDRATRDYAKNASLETVRDIETVMLFVDDDLRETALAIGRIEAYLVHTLQTLERSNLRRSDVTALADDLTVLDHLDLLNETIEGLRRRLARLAQRMR